MATLSSRLKYVSLLFKRNLYLSASRFKEMPDPLDLATGIERKEMLARLSGIENPFDHVIHRRGPGTRDCPTQVPSAYDARIIGCICNEETYKIIYMYLYSGGPVRCACGHWYELVYRAPME